MATVPSILTHDIDGFQDRQAAFLERATPEELGRAVYQFAVQIEEWANEGALHAGHELHDYVNNGTALTLSIVMELQRRLERERQTALAAMQVQTVIQTVVTEELLRKPPTTTTEAQP